MMHMGIIEVTLFLATLPLYIQTKTTALRLIITPMAFPPAMPKTCDQGLPFSQ